MRTIKIITVEDDPYFLRIMNQSIRKLIDSPVFEGYTFEIKSFSTGHEALEEVAVSVDILVIDLVLPPSGKGKNIQGLDVLREIEARKRQCDIIVVSGEVNIERVSVFFGNRVKGFVPKDENMINRLVRLVEVLLLKRIGCTEIPGQN